MTTSTLSFTVRPVANGADLRRACEVRAEGYGHHMPSWRQSLIDPDALDRDPSVLVLLCEDKRTGAAIGTSRVQTNRDRPLMIEQSLALPASIARLGRAEITRLSTVQGADPLVKIALCKAAFLHCMATQSRFMVIGARNEALVRQYRRVGFEDVYPDQGMIPLAHTGGLPHRVLAMDTFAAPRTWQQSNLGLFDFFFETLHPDIDIAQNQRVPQHLEAMAA
jgi:hypothetical protein